MSATEVGILGALQTAISEARSLFTEGREALEASLGAGFVDARTAADTLLSLTDEYGPDHALDLLRERPLDFGEINGSFEVTEDLALHVGALHSMQERLDGLTADRERHAPRAEAQAINIQGDEYLLDSNARELKSVDRPNQRTRVDLDHPPRERPGLAESLATRPDVQVAQPRSQPERDRGRTR